MSLMVGTVEHCEWYEANLQVVGQSNLVSASAEPSAHGDEPSVRVTLRRGHPYMKILRDRGELNRYDTLTQW